jgi:hypothetical protein
MKTGRIAYNQSVTMAMAENANAMPPLWRGRHVPPVMDLSQAYGIGRHQNKVKKKQTMLYIVVGFSGTP